MRTLSRRRERRRALPSLSSRRDAEERRASRVVATVVEGGATLVLRHSGAFELYREDGKEGDAGRIPSSNAGSPSVLPSGEVVARGAVTLPEGALLAESVVTVDPAAGVTSVEWRDDAHRLLAG